MTERQIKWNHQLSYIVGLMISDGNLSPDGRHLNITSKDLQLINTFKKCLCLDNELQLKKSGFPDCENRKYYFLRFGNKKLYDWFLKIGLTPNKSKTLEKIDVPDEFFF